ncbi:hypothetical protein UlMin_039413 [Ulmus minor]
MASSSSQLSIQKRQTFSAQVPEFFSIICQEEHKEKLLVCEKFVRLHGNSLSNSVILKIPCGSEWTIGLEKKDLKVWLFKGWSDFSKYYCLKIGYLIVFRYEGASHFRVSIFDKSTFRINYPTIPINFEESENGHEPKIADEHVVPNLDSFEEDGDFEDENDEDDDYVEVLNFFSSKIRKKNPPPCPRPRKINRASPIGKEVGSSSMANGGSYTANSELRGMNNFFYILIQLLL